MIGDYPIVMKDDLDHVGSRMNMSSINFINTKRKLKMKTIATLIATLFVATAFATETPKPVGPATPAATAPAAPAKSEMKLAKKKEDKKADATKSAKPATPVKNEKATVKTEPTKPAAPATK